LTLNKRFSATASAIPLDPFRHTKIVGGSADTEQNADTVAPRRPALPFVVTTVTLAPTPRIAEINAVRCCLVSCGASVIYASPHHKCHNASYLKNELLCIIILKFSILRTLDEIIIFTDIFSNY
jgi:hypothetical protein